MTVSFYIVNDALSTNKVKSTIKFGSMDTINLRLNGFSLFRTKNKQTWNLRAKEFTFMGAKPLENADVALEPQLPYIYVPTSFFNVYANALNIHYKDEFKAEPVCNLQFNMCKFPATCSEMSRAGVKFVWRIYDEVKVYGLTYYIDWDKLLIPGGQIGDLSGD